MASIVQYLHVNFAGVVCLLKGTIERSDGNIAIDTIRNASDTHANQPASCVARSVYGCVVDPRQARALKMELQQSPSSALFPLTLNKITDLFTAKCLVDMQQYLRGFGRLLR